MLLLLVALWTLWGAFWLRRVELRREKEPLVQTMGLAWAREGLGPSVRAAGTRDGRAVEVRWRRGMFGDRAKVRVGDAWTIVGEDGEIVGIVGAG